MITVIDYGAGNLHSVANALAYLGVPHKITSKPEDVSSAGVLLLPGVGHFGQMMRSLETLGLTSPLRAAVARGVPYLGICLGMQALYEASEEAPAYKGLSIFPGTIRRFPESNALKVPHMGWNQLRVRSGSRLFAQIAPEPFLYFAHSYYLPAGQPEAAAEVDYGERFVAAIEKDNVFGTQFHPEKSGEYGLRVLANFARACAPAMAESAEPGSGPGGQRIAR